MRRVHELVERVRSAYPSDRFFDHFAESCRQNPGKAKAYRTYEDAFRWLDPESWSILSAKAIAHYRDHRPDQLKQGFFNQLNEAFAYRFLVRQGYGRVRLLSEGDRRTPDIEYFDGSERRCCEVKTLGVSDEELARRKSTEAFSNVYMQLTDGFFRKLQSVIAVASAQVLAQSTAGMAYLIVIPDDFALDYYEDYRRALAAFDTAEQSVTVYVKFGVRFNRHMRLGGRRTRR